MSEEKGLFTTTIIFGFTIIILLIMTQIVDNTSNNAKACSQAWQMEKMIKTLTSHKGIVTQESAMIWRAYVLDYTADGYSVQEATFELLKKFEANELPTDSLTTSK